MNCGENHLFTLTMFTHYTEQVVRSVVRALPKGWMWSEVSETQYTDIFLLLRSCCSLYLHTKNASLIWARFRALCTSEPCAFALALYDVLQVSVFSVNAVFVTEEGDVLCVHLCGSHVAERRPVLHSLPRSEAVNQTAGLWGQPQRWLLRLVSMSGCM